jgi:hypothetical protein
MPKGKFEVQQKQLEELPAHRPLILYLIAPVYSKDYTQYTNLNKLFKPSPSLPNGVRVRTGNSFNFCVIEANPKLDQLKEQLAVTLDYFKDAAYKVVVVNAHGQPEGVILKDGEVVVGGSQFAELVTPHTSKHNLHVIVFASHAHIFSDQFYSYVQKECPPEVTEVTAITYFTSKASPTSWDRITTAGNGHVEVTRDLSEFIKSSVEPNSPYKVLESKVAPSCTIL